MTTKQDLEKALSRAREGMATLNSLVEERDKKIAELHLNYEKSLTFTTASANKWKEALNAERRRVQEMQVKLDEADNRFRNLNSSLGKSQEMDTEEACKQAAKEVTETGRHNQLLVSYLGNHGLLQDKVPPQEIAMRTIETLLGKVAKLEAEQKEKADA